jgi:hypothetical protein
MVEFSTIHHVGFAVGVVGILFAAKCLFDIADSAKRLVAAWAPEDEEDEEVSSNTTTNPTEAVWRGGARDVAQPSSTAATPGAAHVNPDLTTKTENV